MPMPMPGDYFIGWRTGLLRVVSVDEGGYRYHSPKGCEGSCLSLPGTGKEPFWISLGDVVHEVSGERRGITFTVITLDFENNQIECTFLEGETIIFDKAGMQLLARGPASDDVAS